MRKTKPNYYENAPKWSRTDEVIDDYYNGRGEFNAVNNIIEEIDREEYLRGKDLGNKKPGQLGDKDLP